MNRIQSHYGESYFNKFQKEIGEFTGVASRFIYQPLIKETDTVLDFGCGGGFILKQLNCKEKIGVELNPVARSFCNDNGIYCVENINEIEDEVIDTVISNHCLEHTPNPHELIEKIFSKIKKGGKVIIIVPTDSYKKKWKHGDINYHLYSFSPMNLGNILDSVGFVNIQVAPLFHKCPTRFRKVQEIIGWKLFNWMCRIYGRLDRRDVQILATASKPN